MSSFSQEPISSEISTHLTTCKKISEEKGKIKMTTNIEEKGKDQRFNLFNKNLLKKEDYVNNKSSSSSMFELNPLTKQNGTFDEDKLTKATEVFKCNFCKKEFSTSRALGGHQNAHKEQLSIAKRHNMMDTGAFRKYPTMNPYYSTYQTCYSSPIYGTSGRHSLAVRAESMIQKSQKSLFSENISWKSAWPTAGLSHNGTMYDRLVAINGEGFQGKKSSNGFDQYGISYRVQNSSQPNWNNNLWAIPRPQEVVVIEDDASGLDLDLKL